MHRPFERILGMDDAEGNFKMFTCANLIPLSNRVVVAVIVLPRCFPVPRTSNRYKWKTVRITDADTRTNFHVLIFARENPQTSGAVRCVFAWLWVRGKLQTTSNCLDILDYAPNVFWVIRLCFSLVCKKLNKLRRGGRKVVGSGGSGCGWGSSSSVKVVCTFAGELYGLDYICKESENNSGFRQVRLSNVRFSRVAGARSHVGGRVSFLVLPLGVFAQLRVIF